MKSQEHKVQAHSEYFLYTASQNAKKMFFYPICVGQFHYEENYRLYRDRYDSFLVMLIQEGQCDVKINGDIYQAKVGDIVLIDCYKPHAYGHSHPWSNIWLHFDGQLAREQYENLTKTFGYIIRPRDVTAVEHTLLKILNVFRDKGNIRDASMSKYITNILTELFLSGTKKLSQARTSLDIEGLLSYINENYTKPLPLKELADRSNLSPYYFTRLFSKETGMTPHQYVIATRLNAAKFQLKNTDLSIKEIAFSSGFSSESVFCSTFKKKESVTPSEYRKMNSF